MKSIMIFLAFFVVAISGLKMMFDFSYQSLFLFLSVLAITLSQFIKSTNTFNAIAFLCAGIVLTVAYINSITLFVFLSCMYGSTLIFFLISRYKYRHNSKD